MWNLPTSRYVKAFEPQLNTYSSKKLMKARSCSEDTQMSSSSEEEEDMLPEIVPASSLGSSFSDDSSTLSSSPGRTSPATTSLSVSPNSPRSIFKNYWSSPSSSGGDGLSGEGFKTLRKGSGCTEEELLHMLSSLSMPFVDEDDDPPSPTTATTSSTLTRSSSAQAAPSPKIASPSRASIDDSTIDYGTNNKRPSSHCTPRRQILPTAAPPTPSHASQLHRVALREHHSQRKWSSTTALIKRPTHSCLRPSRYSCSMIDERRLSQQQDEKNARDDAAAAATIEARSRSKSVSFYSQVSVFEFVNFRGLDEVRSNDWSNYFA